MTTQTFEILTDAELEAASGGGLFRHILPGLKKVGTSMANNPDKWADAAVTVHDAVTSKDQLQNLSSTFIV